MHNFISADVRKGGDLLKSFEQSNLVNNREKYEEPATSTSTSTSTACMGHFRGSKNPHFQNEAKCTTFLVKMSFIYMRMKKHFHIKG